MHGLPQMGGVRQTASGTYVDQKNIFVGTHRVCSPEQTLAWVQPLLPSVGITRVADVTHLDSIGLPVFQAIRPASKALSISQGKGITKALAKVSSIMEAIELWHAENPMLPSTWAEVGEMASALPYSVYDLNLVEDSLLHDALPLAWFPAQILGTPSHTYVPANYVHLDFRVSQEWELPTFFRSSNGLASGNILEEALLHGLYEVIERDCITQARKGTLQQHYVDPKTVDGAASAAVLELLYRAGVTVEMLSIDGPTGIPCFSAIIASPEYPSPFGGHGCHLDRDTALSRALTEAVQSRLGYIAGARDDLDRRVYTRLKRRGRLPVIHKQLPPCDFRAIPTTYFPRLQEDLQEVTRRVLRVVDVPPLFVNLTHEDPGIPVVFVIIPAFSFEEEI